jgi:FkbH-like protein
MFKKIEAQNILFAKKLNRLALIDLPSIEPAGEHLSINVWRNHAFETVADIALPYFTFASLSVKFNISSYDDSLQFQNHQLASVELLWLDSDVYLKKLNAKEWSSWLIERIRRLRSLTTAPILVATWAYDDSLEQELVNSLANQYGVYFANLSELSKLEGFALLSQRSATFSGTALSNTAQLHVARELACKWLPAVLLPPIKAIALDLDNTLHSGILGEDGAKGVILTPEHSDLQKFIKTLLNKGIFIALISRNEESDVKNLFEMRQDYPLKWSDFSATEISWGDKSSAMLRIANKLRIGTDSILFIDDNPGELFEVNKGVPGIHLLHAQSDASLTQEAISYYPGLWRWNIEVDDLKRIQDLKANIARDDLLLKATNKEDYYKNLGVTLTFRNNPKDQLTRLESLCAKTNQFNLSLNRSNQYELAKKIEGENSCVSSVSLADRLSDSGIIATIVAEKQMDTLVIHELCISCRAMGRQLEDHIIINSLLNMPNFRDCSTINFLVREGPRNLPARVWLANLLNLKAPSIPTEGVYSIARKILESFSEHASINLIKG